MTTYYIHVSISFYFQIAFFQIKNHLFDAKSYPKKIKIINKTINNPQIIHNTHSNKEMKKRNNQRRARN